jgi:hypothetical protein
MVEPIVEARERHVGLGAFEQLHRRRELIRVLARALGAPLRDLDDQVASPICRERGLGPNQVSTIVRRITAAPSQSSVELDPRESATAAASASARWRFISSLRASATYTFTSAEVSQWRINHDPRAPAARQA